MANAAKMPAANTIDTQLFRRAMRSGSRTRRIVPAVRAATGTRQVRLTLHLAMYSTRHRLRDAEHSISAPARSVSEEDHDARLPQEQTTHEVVTDTPERCQVIDRIVALEGRFLRLHRRP